MADLLDGLIIGGIPKDDLVYQGDIAKETEKLQAVSALYKQDRNYTIGDVVRWKLGLRNRSVAYGQPMIVLGFADAINTLDDPFTPYFKEKLDVKIGTHGFSGDFVIYHVDGNRLEKHDGKIKPEEQELGNDGETRPSFAPKGLPKEEIEALLKKFDETHVEETNGD